MLEIGKKIIIPPNPTNVYKLVISNMSGDGDAYIDTITFFRKDEEVILEDFIELCAYAKRCWDKTEIENCYNNLMDKYPDFAKEYDGEIITRDVTRNHERMCIPSVSKITWFDENGDEFKVKYE